MHDYSTGTEYDAGISAGLDAYDDRGLDRPSGADLEAEAEWMHHFSKRDLTDPNQWPEEAHGRLMEALRAALCDMCGTRAATDHGLCEQCSAFLRSDGASQ